MAKNRKATKPDADGILRTGIYQRRVGKPPKLDDDEMEAAFDRMADDSAKTSQDRMIAIREWLKPFILPFLDGKKYQNIDWGNGQEFFRELPLEDGSIESRQCRNAIGALKEIWIIEHNLGTQNIDLIVWSSIELGRLIERITIRPFEPLVVSGKRSLDRSAMVEKLRPY